MCSYSFNNPAISVLPRFGICRYSCTFEYLYSVIEEDLFFCLRLQILGETVITDIKVLFELESQK